LECSNVHRGLLKFPRLFHHKLEASKKPRQNATNPQHFILLGVVEPTRSHPTPPHRSYRPRRRARKHAGSPQQSPLSPPRSAPRRFYPLASPSKPPPSSCTPKKEEAAARDDTAWPPSHVRHVRATTAQRRAPANLRRGRRDRGLVLCSPPWLDSWACGRAVDHGDAPPAGTCRVLLVLLLRRPRY
jgi:hypothetical protein